MWKYLLLGGGIALSAALQPGPLQAFYFAKVAEQGWKRTLPAAFAPLISDGPIILVTLLLLRQIPDHFQTWLLLAGGFLLLYYAWSTFRSWQSPPEEKSSNSSSAPKTVLQAALINLLNPNPYLGWSLVMGPALLSAWSEQPVYVLGLLLTFYAVLIGVSLFIIALLGTTDLLAEGKKRGLLLISSLVLAGLGIFTLTTGLLSVI